MPWCTLLALPEHQDATPAELKQLILLTERAASFAASTASAFAQQAATGEASIECYSTSHSTVLAEILKTADFLAHSARIIAHKGD